VRLAVRGDPVRLRQVLTNLLSNAVKFTERGSVTLSVTRRGEGRTQHELRFEVSDTGIGIAKDARLFRAFSQADASTTRLYGGTGLGLVICKRIIDLMGGTIGVDSEPGRGSTFWFEIPLLKAAGDIQGQRADLNGARILLLSTDAALRQRLGQAAPGWGVNLTQTETTQDALTRLRTAITRGPSWAFDLLLVDINSVRSTAIALHRNVRRTPELEDLRVVYLQGEEGVAPELTQGPFSLLLPRSIGATELRSGLTSFLAAQAPAPPPPVEPPVPERVLVGPPESADGMPQRGRLRGRVLLVEDNPVNLMVAQRLVGLLGLTCETADNGEKALERMRAGGLDVVLMDCQMPVKDGYTASTEWRQHEEARGLPRLPIIAMTANAMAGDKQKCLDAGMDDYLSKPVDRRLLEATIARWLQERAAWTGVPIPDPAGAPFPAAAAAPAAPEPLAPAPAPSASRPAPPVPAPAEVAAHPRPAVAAAGAPEPMFAGRDPSPPRPAPAPARAEPLSTELRSDGTPLPQVLAMDVVEELRAVMGQEYLGLVRLFLEDAPRHVAALEAAAAAGSMEQMVAPAHTLKSASANLGAMALSAAAKRIELGARGGTLPRPAVAVAVLESEFRRAAAALQGLLAA
jgi:CheY-like chemotaxis protein/HPt (histidine-containing phosphotransfer) domain-containing protein